MVTKINKKKSKHAFNNYKYIYCAYRIWSLNLYRKLDQSLFYLVDSKEKLTLKLCKKMQPEYIFFPDWSWKVPKAITSRYRCVIFHEADLPKFRGGSPIQNQVLRGIKKTKHTVLFMTDEIDAGDILLQRNLNLSLPLDQIFVQIAENVYGMILQIIRGEFNPRKQKGKPTYYPRRKPYESELDMNMPLCKVYDFIRILDDPYPNAFIRIGDKKIVFKHPQLENNVIKFQGEIHE